MAELHGKLERAWALFEEELKVGAAIEALRALSSVSTDIEGLMQEAMKRAASRGVKIIDETFGLTSTDHPDLDYDINNDQIFEWSALFPAWAGPLDLVGVCSGKGQDSTLSGIGYRFGHLYSPVNRMCAHPISSGRSRPRTSRRP